jgi:Putative auto-transporter adhesin, head GIN domain
MKKSIFFGFLAVVTMFLASCNFNDNVWGSGDVITETRTHQDFHALMVSTPGEVEVRTGPQFRVEVSCEESLMPLLETSVDNGVLKVSFRKQVFDADDVRIRVTAPRWDGFEVRGSADVDVVDAIQGTLLDLFVSGSGDVKVFKLDFDRVKARISGSGNVTLTGEADDLNASITGSGNIRALECPVQTAIVTVSGSGDARVNVQKTLEANVSGSGNIDVRGNAVINANVSGSGRVRRI